MDIYVTRGVHENTDTDIENMQDFHPVDTDHFEEQHNNTAKLTALTSKDNLHQ